MPTWTQYRKSDGLFTGCKFSGSSLRAIARKAGDDPFEWLAGDFDHLSQRVDLDTGEVIDYQPPATSPEHEWDERTRRWLLPLALRQAITAEKRAREVIAAAEATSQRALREAMIELLPENSPARQRLLEVDDIVATARQRIRDR